MSEIIKRFPCCSVIGEKVRKLRFYFDTGSPRTFVKQSIALGMKGVAKLPKPATFSGLGNGAFEATHIIHLHIKLLDLWVPHICYVVPDEILDPNYDILLGHDFMQVYDIQIKPRNRKVIIKRDVLERALKVI